MQCDGRIAVADDCAHCQRSANFRFPSLQDVLRRLTPRLQLPPPRGSAVSAPPISRLKRLAKRYRTAGGHYVVKVVAERGCGGISVVGPSTGAISKITISVAACDLFDTIIDSLCLLVMS
jgi:hypothetical protein